jgi:hypothetical protein
MAPRRSWVKANNPFWSKHIVAWYQGALEAEHYCRKQARSFDDKLDAVGASSAERGRSAQTCSTSAEFASEGVETAAEEGVVEAPKEASALSLRRAHGQRSDWSMHVEAMNFGGMGHAEYAAAFGLSPHSLRIWRDRLEQSSNEMVSIGSQILQAE